MRLSRLSLFVISAVLIFVAVLAWVYVKPDVVAINNGSGAENGILVSGQDNSGLFADRTFTSGSATVEVGRVSAAAGRNEVIGFTNSRPVAIAPATWTSGSDPVNLAFAGEIPISITLWIIDTPFAAQQLTAATYCAAAATMWTAERMGVAFAPGGGDIRDVTTAAGISMLQGSNARNFRCGNDEQRLASAGPPIPGRINIYLVHSVKLTISLTGLGWTRRAAGATLWHWGRRRSTGPLFNESGHTFSLLHIDGMTGFDVQRISCTAPAARGCISRRDNSFALISRRRCRRINNPGQRSIASTMRGRLYQCAIVRARARRVRRCRSDSGLTGGISAD